MDNQKELIEFIKLHTKLHTKLHSKLYGITFDNQTTHLI